MRPAPADAAEALRGADRRLHSVQHPSLAGVRVLVDTFNLRLPRGTGIRRYGQTLVAALRSLGAEVSLLTDRQMRTSDIPELDEVLFFDARVPVTGRGRRVRELLRMAGAAVRPRKAEEISVRRVVAPREQLAEVGPSSVFNLSECYESANRLFQHTRRYTRVGLERPVALWHATYPLPLAISGARHVTTVHDLIPLRLPHTTLDDKVFFFRLVREAVERSDLVITPSEHTRQDLLETFNAAPDKVVVTYQPVPEPSSTDEIDADRMLRRLELRRGGYLLFVGNIEPKKNLGRLLRAFADLDTELPLVVVGARAWLWEDELRGSEALFEPKRSRPPRVRLLDHVSRPELEALYANATCLVFPSLYEGFGLPPLEAMRNGCPVLTSETSSLPELCGDAALYVDPYSVADLRVKLTRMIESEALRKRLVQRGHERVQRFGMRPYQARLGAAYARVL